MLSRITLLALLLLPAPSTAQVGGTGGGSEPVMIPIPAGRFVAQYGPDPIEVAAFEIDRVPVTVEDYLTFVRDNPKWRRSRVKRVFAAKSYLERWEGDLDPGLAGEARRRAITEVSWFAARAYCAARGARLPRVDEWEYVAQASASQANAHRDAAFNRDMLTLLSQSQGRPPQPVGSLFENYYGVWDLHGGPWEWVRDFNSVLLTGASRVDAALDRGLFCASGSIGATDIENYVAFLRYSFRAGLEADYTSQNFGFRCAR